ncbi:MAG: NifB/NifX family molybdenum-iron cluster-binding protein [Phycisphaerales bacterium]|nr:MAG: NifB/NifX family molybdenum-iron cluster-binding protein [Phycisphaerales bacterium]
MRICIPTTSDRGPDSNVHKHFGSAPYFTICDTETATFETIENTNGRHVHGACRPMARLAGSGIDAVVCRAMGRRALQQLNRNGLKAYRADASTVSQIVKMCADGAIEEMTAESACTNHRCE